MAENKEEKMDNNEKRSDDAVDPTHILLESLHNLLLKNQNEQEKFNEEMRENQRLNAENFKKLSEEQQKITLWIDRKSDGTDQIKRVEPIDIDTSPTSSDSIVTPTTYIPSTGKTFVLKHVFNDVSNMEETKVYLSDEEEHFGVPWNIGVSRDDDWLAIHLFCKKSLNDEKWSIESKYELKLISKSGKHRTEKLNSTMGNSNGNMQHYGFGRMKFIEWEKLEKDYVNDDQLTTEIQVHISKMTGIYKDDLKIFDESMAKFSDVILIVNERKFYVSKLFLATNSPYFESLFLGQFQESKKSEINLSGIDDDDFQNYLEVLYGEDPIDEFTVEGILLVADMFDTPIVIQKCDKFLMKKSQKTMRKKLEMATKYNLEQLKEKCMEEIKTVTDIRSILPGNIHDLDPTIVAALLVKSLKSQE